MDDVFRSASPVPCSLATARDLPSFALTREAREVSTGSATLPDSRFRGNDGHEAIPNLQTASCHACGARMQGFDTHRASSLA